MKNSGSPRAEVAKELALDLKRQLESLALFATEDSAADSLADTALAGADLATLAVCNAAALGEKGSMQALAAAQLAAGAVRAALVLLETYSEDSGGDHAENLARDARGAAWRVDLAVRQADEATETSG